MRQCEMVIATTHIDRHNEQITLDCLQSMVPNFSSSYLPVTIEHDPRNAPIGRCHSALVRQRSDGEHELVVIADIFEPGDDESETNERHLKVSGQHRDGLAIEFDRTYCDEADQEDVLAIANLFGTAPVEQAKKSLDPISVIQVSGLFILAAITNGFFGQIGADGWNLLKSRLSSMFERKRQEKKDYLFIFDAIISCDSQEKVDIQVIFTNPDKSDFAQRFIDAINALDLVLPIYIGHQPEMRRFVFEVEQEGVDLKFTLRSDCLPFKPQVRTKELIRALRSEKKDKAS